MSRKPIEGLPPMFPGGNRIGAEEEAAVLKVLRSKRLFRYYGAVEGPSTVEAFERDVAQLLGATHAIAVASGTTALTTALAAAGVGPGDQVIVPAYTWVSTAAAVVAVGAVPVIAEVDETLTIDVADAATLVNERTKAIIPVHMRGAAADMRSVMDMARRHDLVVIEDAAQAMGGSFAGRRLGTIGDIGCFSLQYNKIITCGEGGIVTTNDAGLHARALMYHDVAAGMRVEAVDRTGFYGITCRMSELQGAVAGVQLRRLDEIIAACRAKRERIVDLITHPARSKGVRLRGSHDEAGDTAIALVLLCPEPQIAGVLVRTLQGDGIDAEVLFDPEVADLHVAPHWRYILEARTWSTRGPWSEQAGDFTYGPERWSSTVKHLSSSVHIDISPDLTSRQVELVGAALRDALANL
jgi:8-amino-3,8-dideoxy-alpha-D-manno-octulosonate transaminase